MSSGRVVPRCVGGKGMGPWPPVTPPPVIVVEAPERAGASALTWTVTLLTAEGEALARDRASSPDFPVPLTRIVEDPD